MHLTYSAAGGCSAAGRRRNANSGGLDQVTVEFEEEERKTRSGMHFAVFLHANCVGDLFGVRCIPLI